MSKKNVVIVGHSSPDVDSVISGFLLEKYLLLSGVNASFVIPDHSIDIDTVDILSICGVDYKKYQKDIPVADNIQYILVDHHDRELPNGLKPIMILDHHPDDSFIPPCSDYINDSFSSTSCLIGRKYETLLSKEDFILVLIAALVDTTCFHSTKTSKKDTEWLLKKCNEFSIRIEDYTKVGLALTPLDVDNVIFHGQKKYCYRDLSFESSYIQIDAVDAKSDLIDHYLQDLHHYVVDHELYEFAFIIHDMDQFKTTVYHIYPNTIEKIQYDYLASRGNTIIPDVRSSIDYFLTSGKKITSN